MMKYIDSKQLVTLILAAVVVFFLQKYLTKKVTNKDGSVSHYAGNETIGTI
jgi:hypothetical protein